jgi:hypothetical protein
MRFLTGMALVVGCSLFVAGSALQAPPVQAQSNTAVVTFYNNTSSGLTFSVDDIGYTCRVGVQYGSCNARAAVGGHTLYARYDDGTVAASRAIDLPAGGFDWTIREIKE